MKNRKSTGHFQHILAAVLLSVLFTVTICNAMDNEGCLTCHQYPGLISGDSDGNYKVLHIDENKYLRSPHGTLDCRTCHESVKKIPHSGETVVHCSTECHGEGGTGRLATMDSYNTGTSCTSDCHSNEHDVIKPMKDYLRSFHDSEQSAIRYLENKSSCRICHSLYPHNENRRVRAFINMHVGFMTCEVCHTKINTRGNFSVCKSCHTSTRRFSYDWKSPDNVEFTGEPYGTFSKNKPESQFVTNMKLLLRELFQEYVPEKYLPKINKNTDYALSRIAVYSDGNKIVLNDEDTEKALYYLQHKNRFSEASKRRRLQSFHREIARIDVSVLCNECHREDGVLDFSDFGFDTVKVNKLKKLNIKGFATKYTTFYFPNLLNASMSRGYRK